MMLISTERKQLNPEDDIGNMNNVGQRGKPILATSQKTTTSSQRQQSPKTVNVNTVRLIKPVPKANARPENADSGLASSVSAWSFDA